ncbi:MAG: DUF2911 domain-containing protein [Lewinellaceae bacterium]|nr:DUF2911 domain-containing protein [Lewinellaceae bacterium]
MKAIYTTLFVIFLTASAIAQNTSENFIIPKTNSKAVIQQTIASTQIEVTYNRPNKRGRKIFGNLVPYDQIWRTGADAATEIYFSTPVILAGNPLDSGRYELFTIPGKSTWEVILQKSQHQWGSYKYNPENDAVRFSVKSIKRKEIVETFTISLDNIGSDRGMLHISWDQVLVPVDIKIDLKHTVIPDLEKALTGEGRRPYFQVAMFYYENNLDINRAAELMSMALEKNPNHIGMLYRYALILKQKGDIPGAMKASEKSFEQAQSAGEELKAEYTRLNTKLQAELKSLKH